jgi:hypothetical protein
MLHALYDPLCNLGALLFALLVCILQGDTFIYAIKINAYVYIRKYCDVRPSLAATGSRERRWLRHLTACFILNVSLSSCNMSYE